MSDQPDVVDQQAVQERNLAIWNQVCKTDPDFTKAFNNAGFKGTMTNACFQALKATALFGPVGIGWGIDLIEDRIEGHEAFKYEAETERGEMVVRYVYPRKIWMSKIRFWYIDPATGKRGEVYQWGGTDFLGINAKGPFIDDDAAKKSVTDAFTKCLSYLGFSADIHMGRYDDAKYVARLRDEFAEKKARGAGKKASEPQPKASDPAPGPSARPEGAKAPENRVSGQVGPATGQSPGSAQAIGKGKADEEAALAEARRRSREKCETKISEAKGLPADQVLKRLDEIKKNIRDRRHPLSDKDRVELIGLCDAAARQHRQAHAQLSHLFTKGVGP